MADVLSYFVAIDLDNYEGSYNSGDEVRGRVSIKSFPNFQAVDSLSIVLEGKGRVCFTEEHLAPFSKFILNHPEKFLNGENYSSEVVEVECAKHYGIQETMETYYPFKLSLPKGLPGSFEHENGHISYSIKVNAKNSTSDYPAMLAKLPINIQGVLDLNVYPSVRRPFVIARTKEDGKFSFVAELRKSGYVPGENVQFVCQFSNRMSRKAVRSMRASILQVVTFHARDHVKSLTTQVSSVYCGEVDTGRDCITWSPDNLYVPQVPPTGLGGGCGIIDIKYFLRFKATFSGITLHAAFMRQVPIIIGTVPLKEFDRVEIIITEDP